MRAACRALWRRPFCAARTLTSPWRTDTYIAVAHHNNNNSLSAPPTSKKIVSRFMAVNICIYCNWDLEKMLCGVFLFLLCCSGFAIVRWCALCCAKNISLLRTHVAFTSRRPFRIAKVPLKWEFFFAVSPLVLNRSRTFISFAVGLHTTKYIFRVPTLICLTYYFKSKEGDQETTGTWFK